MRLVKFLLNYEEGKGSVRVYGRESGGADDRKLGRDLLHGAG